MASVFGSVDERPFTVRLRLVADEAGMLLLRFWKGENMGLPHSRPMPDIGLRCHEH